MTENVSHEISRSTDIEEQIAAKQAGRRKVVCHHGTLCSRCYAAQPRSKGQRYCKDCHAASERAARARRSEELKRLKAKVGTT